MSAQRRQNVYGVQWLLLVLDLVFDWFIVLRHIPSTVLLSLYSLSIEDYLTIKNNVIMSLDGTTDHHFEQGEPTSERQIPCFYSDAESRPKIKEN
jgi:hypothetical protein